MPASAPLRPSGLVQMTPLPFAAAARDGLDVERVGQRDHDQLHLRVGAQRLDRGVGAADAVALRELGTSAGRAAGVAGHDLGAPGTRSRPAM